MDTNMSRQEKRQTGHADMTMRGTLKKGIDNAPDNRVALRFFVGNKAHEVTYGRLKACMGSLPAAVAGIAGPGKRIAVRMDGSADSVMVFLSLLCSDNPPVLIPREEAKESLEEKLSRTEAALLIGGTSAAVTSWPYSEVERIFQQNLNRPSVPAVRQKEDDEAFLLFTSGTTGVDKCVVRTQRNAAVALKDLLSPVRHGREQLLILPACHQFAVARVILPTFALGRTLTLSRGISHWLEEIREYKIEELFAVPAQASLLGQLLEADQQGLPHLRHVVSAGAALPEQTLAVLNRAGIQVADVYGMSETGPIAGYDIRRGSVGTMRRYLEWRLDNPDENGIGELLLKGPSISSVYIDPGPRYRATCTDGWFSTGDLACLDEDGFLFLKGRIKNLIILESGKNISPEELEARFLKSGVLKECQAYACGNRICMNIVPGDDIAREALAEALQTVNALLPSWKKIHSFYVCSELERTSTGKLKRNSRMEPDEKNRLALAVETDENTAKTTKDAVISAFRAVFGTKDITESDDFFELGGDSLLGMNLVAHLRKRGYGVTVRDLFTASRVKDLTAVLKEHGMNQADPSLAYENQLRQMRDGKVLAPGLDEETVNRIRNRFQGEAVEAIYPVWGAVSEDLEKDKLILDLSGGYFLDRMLILKQPLEKEEFLNRMKAIAKKHPVLRSKWVKDAQQWFQVVTREGTFPACYEDRRNQEGEPTQKLKQIQQEYHLRYTARENEKLPQLLSVWVYRLRDDLTVMLVELTHLFTDGHSTNLLMKELVEGIDTGMPDHYHRYRLWQYDQQGRNHSEIKTYWDGVSRVIAERPYQPFSDCNESKAQEWKAGFWREMHSIRLDTGLVEKLMEYAARWRVTVSEVISWAYHQSLMQCFGMEAMLFQESFSGRENVPFEARGIFGYLVCNPVFFLNRKDTIRDYHNRLANYSRHLDHVYRPFWDRLPEAPMLLNRVLYTEEWLSKVRSFSRLYTQKPLYFKGNDIRVSYLRKHGNTYTLDMFCTSGDQGRRKAKAAEKEFRRILETLSGEQRLLPIS